jgi:aspartate/methionine/tyrosine aminotransferase
LALRQAGRRLILLEDAQIAATGMRGWGGEVAERYVRLVFSAEPVDRLQEIPERVAGTKLAEAVASRV